MKLIDVELVSDTLYFYRHFYIGHPTCGDIDSYDHWHLELHNK